MISDFFLSTFGWRGNRKAGVSGLCFSVAKTALIFPEFMKGVTFIEDKNDRTDKCDTEDGVRSKSKAARSVDGDAAAVRSRHFALHGVPVRDDMGVVLFHAEGRDCTDQKCRV